MEQVYTGTNAMAGARDDASFLRGVYLHLLGAVTAFIGLEVVLFSTGIAQALAPVMTSNWLIVIGGFMVLGWLTSYFTSKSASTGAQYAQLAVIIGLQALIFIPLLVYAVYFTDPSVLTNAALVTLMVFTGATAIAAYSGKNFSFLGPFLGVIGIGALIAIVGSLLFGVTLGFYFAVGMAVFAAVVVLYETSNVINEYGEGQQVMAATALFSSVALLFYYVLAAFISRD